MKGTLCHHAMSLNAEDLIKSLQGARPHSSVAFSTPHGTYEVERVVIDVNTPGVILIAGRGFKTCPKHNVTYETLKCPMCEAEYGQGVLQSGTADDE
jgi:hypothetical protein